ncbi:MAG: hypothetical protein CEN87_130 [Parcubacteria group bacterium Licking1014_1]|nr:MAG: hypothetical protein CEN87_130 [Parcubacteria group bacterium Licking1014_1]
MKQLLDLTRKYLKEVISAVNAHAEGKTGRGFLGLVAGRPKTEDVKIELDEICENIFKKLLKKSKLPVRVFSEHGTYGSSFPEYFCSIDPFDGSALYLRGLRAEWYSVLSFFDLDGVPLAGGTADILQKRIYLADGEKNKCFFFDKRGRISVLSRPKKETFDNQTILSAYLMAPKYLLPWAERMKKLLEKFQGIFIWPNGGAGIYHMIAEGKVDAYIMFDEPRSEIDPGLAFAQVSGFPVVSVRDDWTCENYQFLPDRQSERVPFFITAATYELILAILKKVKEANK